MIEADKIIVIDFGSQYTNVIARRVREIDVYTEVLPYWKPLAEILKSKPRGIILSGGPSFVNKKNSPRVPVELFNSGIPILGVCYGLQLMAHLLKGKVAPGQHREYGHAELTIKKKHALFRNIPKTTFKVWMSHGDQVTLLPPGFVRLADSPITKNAVIADDKHRLYGIQFHPEVAHTQYGKIMLKNFVLNICSAKPQWKTNRLVEESIIKIKTQVGKSRVICALSGGVDSTVAATLVHRAIGKQLKCIYVDTGLMRLNETPEVLKGLRTKLHLPVISIDAKQLFMRRLKGITDPEQKRKIIGKAFIDVFIKAAKNQAEFLVQGTLYSDVIESAPAADQGMPAISQTIKSHHNVGGLPAKLGFKLIEPLREMFKDEVRRVGLALNIPKEIINRHPFPGPGLAIRIIGEITPARLEMLRHADAIMTSEIKLAGWYERIWQSAVILTGVRSTAVMGDERTYHEVCAIRLVHSVDAMTAHWVELPANILAKISNRIVNEVPGISRVVYDITNKPPATIEWE